MIRLINYRNLVNNIIQDEYDRLEIPLNEDVINGITWFAWDVSDNSYDIKCQLIQYIKSTQPFGIFEEFEYKRVSVKISDAKQFATYCSV